MSQQTQQDFEQWLESVNGRVPACRDGVYMAPMADIQWAAWQEQQKKIDHWKANHQNMVDRARFLIERTDLPVERIKAWEEMGRLQAEVERLRLAIKAEAEYCQGWADQFKGEDRGKRHQDRADRLRAYLKDNDAKNI